MVKYRIEYKAKDCIGAGECEKMSPELWKLNNKGKAELKGSVLNPATGICEIEIDESAYPLQKRIASACPATCIKIK